VEDDDDFVITEEELVIDQLLQAGADLEQPRRAEHYLLFPSRLQADPAAEEVRRLGLGARVELDDVTHEWLVTASHQIVVSERELARLHERLEALANVHGGTWDGWDFHVHENEEDESDVLDLKSLEKELKDKLDEEEDAKRRGGAQSSPS
jgi:Regulator of ribonuclease activity B